MTATRIKTLIESKKISPTKISGCVFQVGKSEWGGNIGLVDIIVII